ncbi:MAG: tetratricopeptide repeat protein [Candidatus Acidiferrales bacterium]
MKGWNYLAGKLFGRRDQTGAMQDLALMMKEAHELLKAAEYEKAQPICLKMVEWRERLHDGAIIEWILTGLAATWLLRNRFDEQIVFFSQYLERYPSDCIAYCERAGALWYSGRLGDAIGDYNRAIELQPTHLLSRSGRGQVLAELGESAKALDDLDIAVRIIETTARPDESWREWLREVEAFVRNGRAVAFAGLGQNRESCNEFEASIALSPDNAWVYYNRARAGEISGDKDRALSDYRISLEKIKPRLTPIQKDRAQERIHALSEN